MFMQESTNSFFPNPESNNPTALPQSRSDNLGINYHKQSETFLMIFVFGIEKHAKLDTQKTTTSHLLNNND